jgi:exopolysaccharide biosynthesis polyprenyl glycosylphosphotransferase
MRIAPLEKLNRKTALQVLLVAVDWAVIFFALVCAQWLRFSTGWFGSTSRLSHQNLLLIFFVSGAWLLIFAGYGLYRERNYFPIMDHLFRVLKAVVIGTLLLLTLVFVLKAHAHLQSRLFIGFGFLTSLAFTLLWRGLIFSKLIYPLFGGKGAGRRALIVGTGERGRQLAKHITEYSSLGLDVIGFIQDHPESATEISSTSTSAAAVSSMRILGSTDDIAAVVKKYDVGEIFLGVPSLTHGELINLIDTCKATRLPVTLTSELLDVVSQHSPVGKIDGVPTVTIQPRGFSEVNLVFKRFIDLLIGTAGLILALPVLAVSAVLIKLDSSGPIFFRQQRLGRRGRPFTIYKLRTMVSRQNDDIHRKYLREFIANNRNAGNAQNGDQVFKLDNDPRVTRVGKYLRRLSIDELPQLINVIRGEMSLVGPRPPLPYEAELYKEWHNKRLQVKPGITGLWQVTARSAVSFDDMVMLDLYYVEHWSLLFDLQLMLKTIPAAFSGKGAL